jgi:hypothetical protein
MSRNFWFGVIRGGTDCRSTLVECPQYSRSGRVRELARQLTPDLSMMSVNPERPARQPCQPVNLRLLTR